jgi:hypothetical protein
MKKNTILKIGDIVQVAKKEMEEFEKKGYEVSGQQFVKGYLSKNYTDVEKFIKVEGLKESVKAEGFKGVMLEFYDILYDETLHIYATTADVIEEAYKTFGRDELVGAIISKLKSIDDLITYNNFLWIFFKWTEEYDKENWQMNPKNK